MAISQLKTVARHAEHLMSMLKPDTDLPEWVQSKITLATDYLQTAHDYMMSEMNEAANPAQQAAIAINMKKKGIKPKNEEVELNEKKKFPGLWANIHAKRKRGEAPAKPGNEDYPKTLNIEDTNPCWTGYKRKPGTKKYEPGSCVKEGAQDDPKADQMTTDDNKFPKKSRKAAIVKSAAKKIPAEDQFQAKPVLDSQVAQQTNKQ